MTTGVETKGDRDEIVSTIRRMTAANGYAPTTRELAARFNMGVSAMHKYLVDLRAAARVDWDDGRARTLRVLDGRSQQHPR